LWGQPSCGGHPVVGVTPVPGPRSRGLPGWLGGVDLAVVGETVEAGRRFLSSSTVTCGCNCKREAGQDAETGPSTAAATASALPSPVTTSSR